jgi:diguanylate cyclase (GGDEF)-like protein/putative nucleotidyltransferase with HDIG domain
MNEDKLVAILALGEKRRGRYSVEDITLLESITKQVAIHLEKEHFHELLKEREEELALLNELTRVITSSLNIQEVYTTFVARLAEVVRVDWAAIALVEENELVFQAVFAEGSSPWQQGDRIPLRGTGIELALKRRKAVYEPDLVSGHKFWTGEHDLKHGIRSIVYTPLMAKGEPTGGLLVGSREPAAYTPEHIQLLERLAAHIVMPVENSRLYAKAEQRARIDELTGLFNRRHLDERLRQEIDERQRYGGMLSVMMLDLDFFKVYNDKYGHKAGDAVLREVAKVIRGAVRSMDMVFRYGGDEFVILLPQTDGQAAFVVAERVRAKIAQEMKYKQPKITASIGLATWPGDGVTVDALMNATDRALYYAKQTGGNRIGVASRMLLPSVQEAAHEVSEKEALSVIYALASTIEARDPYTYGHSRKVSAYAVALAEAIGLPPDKVAVVSTAALLHDIGKIGVPDEILNSPDKLDAKAWELIWSHPKLSATIVGHVFSLVSCLPAILHHHERWDGGGYPAGLKGESIPIEARILAVADAFDAMTSSRPYRGALSYQEAIAEMKRCSGSQFDPQLVEVFLPVALSAFTEGL